MEKRDAFDKLRGELLTQTWLMLLYGIKEPQDCIIKMKADDGYEILISNN